MRSLKRLGTSAALVTILLCRFCPILADGLQGEFIGTGYWRDLLSRYSPLTNPAFMTEENYLSVRMAEAIVLQTFNLTEVGVTMPAGLYQSWGFSYFGQAAGSIPAAINDVAGDSIKELGQSLSDSKHFFMLSYADNIVGKLSIGANATFSYETNFSGNGANDQITDAAADVGISYRALFDPVLGEHLLGLSVQNILSPFDFGKLSYSNNVKFAWLAYYWDRRIETGLEIDSKNVYGALFRDKDPAHMEYTYAARLGGWIFRFLNVYAQAGSNYYSFAGGVNVPQFNNGRDLSFLYQYLTKTDAAADAIHSFYVRVQFGEHREETYAQRMARFADVGPNDLYNKACKLYYAGNNWDAFFVFSQILVQYPAFFKNDKVAYFKASCMERLDMRDEAVKSYASAAQTYPTSSIVPHVNLGLMRIYYRDDSFQSVYDRYQSINRPEVPDSLKYQAYYLMAESYFKKKNYFQASRLFSQIPETNDQYIFAQHTLAIIHILNSDMDSAIAALANCLQANAPTSAQKEIANRSYVLLGYIFYGQNSMSKAVSALRMVPKSSYYYEDAVSGLCWSALRARQWNDCIASGQELQKISDKPVLQCDGALIEGYGNFMTRNYKQATAILMAASEKAKGLKSLSSDTLETRRSREESDRGEYNELATSVDRISQEMQSSLIVKRVDSLHSQQQARKKTLDEFSLFADEFGRQAFFARNMDVITSDINYSLAISQKMSLQSPSADVQKKMDTKQKEIDQKIDKLKKEIGKLNSGGE
jgi:tetratricopeptide (TPR) repeat protein